MSKLNELRDLLRMKASKNWYAKKLNISELEVENLLKELRDRRKEGIEIEPEITLDEGESIIQNIEAGTLKSTKIASEKPTTPEAIIALHEVDITKWKLSQYWSKQKKDRWIVSALFTAIKIEESLPLQKDIILDEIKLYLAENQHPAHWKPLPQSRGKDHLYEISLPDLHFGKQAWEEEVGQEYNLKIAEERATDAVDCLLGRVNLDLVEKFLFPVGNDLFNVDNNSSTTSAGTPQDQENTRIHKMVRTVYRAMIRQIDKLASIAPVDVPIVRGNHDELLGFMIGEILGAHYHLNPNVTIQNSAAGRKYYQYYDNGFQFTHGDTEPINQLGIIFAAEQKKLWADTTFRYCQLGHFHKEKKIEFLTGDSFQGFQVEILPSLSGPDKWHNGKGYISNRAAKSFLYHRNEGEVGSFKYTVI
jgi:hypothetical protein